ncbi:hypothetical protein PsYK624_119370 [Phanerochaete sordida]|uniref:Uncharacterized protein n=1 Tax=Phanerochaete sordida TaxID=48140 RepID=A0A9P3GIJ9_9APHY|nr:hypothetical protein PsYK624_119370 [Phanerochaete sordida]
MPVGGARPRHIILSDLLERNPTLSDPKRAEELSNLVLAQERKEARWINSPLTTSIYSPNCEGAAFISASGLVRACTTCAKLLKVKIFTNALRRPPPSPDNAKYTPKTYRNELTGQAYLRHVDVRELSEKGHDLWWTLAKRGLAGRYDNFDALKGLLEVIIAQEDRESRGVGLKNMKYPHSFDEFCTTLAAVSPAAYRSFRAEFGGRSLSSMRAIRSALPRFQPGIVDVNFERLVQFLDAIGCRNMPVTLAVDDTKLHPGLRPYKDSCGSDGTPSWKLAGAHGKVPEFKDYDQLSKLVSELEGDLADKVRAWLVVVGNPEVPPFPLALIPIKASTTQQELRAWHDDIEGRMQRFGINYVSYLADGAANERRLQHDLLTKAVAANQVRRYSFKSPISSSAAPVEIVVPLLENGRPRVVTSDMKHSRKNARGSVQSGSHTIGAGYFVAHIGQLRKIALAPDSPLLHSDIIGGDKQDDRAAARLFSSAVIEHLSETQKTELGLAVYLFVIGELVDAQQNRKTPHSERMKAIWRARFFLDGWLQFINDHPLYAPKTHFISRELYDIFNLIMDGLLGLILVYRDFYPTFPLLPWLHSTETNEHFYGCARKIVKDFTFGELIYMMPKLTRLIDRDIKNAGAAHHSAASHKEGYHHTWFDSRHIEYAALVSFPSDDEISSEILPNAYDEAIQLLSALGMHTSEDSQRALQHAALQGIHTASSSLQEAMVAASRLATREDLTGADYGEDPEVNDIYEDTEGHVTDAHLPSDTENGGEDEDDSNRLGRLLLAESHELSRGKDADKSLDNLATAACANAVYEATTIDTLPEAGQDELADWRHSVQNCLSVLEAHLEQQAALLTVQQPASTADSTALSTVLPHPRSRPLTLYTPTTGLNLAMLVEERRRHETEESRAAVTWRFKNRADLRDASTDAGSEVDPLRELDPSRLKAKIVNEIVRVQTANSQAAKRAGSGLDRAVRWKTGATLKGGTPSVPAVSDSPAAKGERSLYGDSAILRQLPWRWNDAGVSSDHPLRGGSPVLVVHMDQVFFALGHHSVRERGREDSDSQLYRSLRLGQPPFASRRPGLHSLRQLSIPTSCQYPTNRCCRLRLPVPPRGVLDYGVGASRPWSPFP